MITALLLLTWAIPIAINVWAAAKRQKPVYIAQFLLRAMASILHGSLFIQSEKQWPLYITLVVFQTTSFWIIFEVWLNLIWGEHPLYFDSKERDSGYIDRFFAGMGTSAVFWHFLAKCVALILLILSIVVIYDQV